VRTLDLSKLEKTDDQRVSFMLSADVQMKLMLVRVPKEYDLVRSYYISRADLASF